ncbi:hypothetical protein FI069_14425 [Salmonella enterica subsp. enterica]|nr:hypothetical protein [Salmonella enterica]EBG5098739.1 hypothetical protein [Salmonella enterica subsp. enterica serovar India]
MPQIIDHCIVPPRLQIQASGLEPRKTSLTIQFFVSSTVTPQWRDRAGASQDAPVSVRLVVPTPSGSATREIGTSGGGSNNHSLEVALWLQSSQLTMIYSLFPSAPPRILPP